MKRAAVVAFAVALVVLSCANCALTGHEVVRSSLGTPRSYAELGAAIDAPGPVVVETVVSAGWTAARSGLINLKDPRARAAGLTNGGEPIDVRFHALRHPTRGLFIVDTGVERAIRDEPSRAAFRWPLAAMLTIPKMVVRVPLGEWLAAQPEPLRGVFLTHLHPDHLTGMADVPAGTPVFAGPGEATAGAMVNVLLRTSVDRAFAGKAPISEWPFVPPSGGPFEAVVDVFGDGTTWALWVPGHTIGSTAYVVRTPAGPVLITGDASHTRWGWENGVEPGRFSRDRPRSARSLAALRTLAQEHPQLEVRVGHQQ